MDPEIRETCRAPEVYQNAVSDILGYTITVICTGKDILWLEMHTNTATCLLCPGSDES